MKNSNLKILVVEDNFMILEEIKTHLEDLGYKNTETALDGEECIKKALKYEPDLIISDINLGKGIDGIEAVEKIQEMKYIPVIYLTAYNDEKTFLRAKLTEPYSFLVKPMKARDLEIAISICTYKEMMEEKLKETNEKLVKANAAKETFINILGHDLKNPLTVIISFCKVFEDIDKLKKEEIKQLVKSLNENANQMNNLLNNLLEWSRLQQENILFNPQKAKLLDIVNKCLLLIESQAKIKKIHIDVHIPKNIELIVDIEMISTVIRNIVSNAIKFTKESGQISITAIKNDKNVEIEISDTGVGMSKETINTLYKLGEKKSKKGTNGERGTGFGLLFCKDFIDKHNGKININSELNKGTKFTIELPI